MQRKSNTRTQIRYKHCCSLPSSCPSPYNMTNVCRAGIQSQPTSSVIIECLSFTVHLIICKHHSLPHILLHCEHYPIIKQDESKQCHKNMNLILCSEVLKKDKWLKENPKPVIPHIQRWQHDHVRYLEIVKYSNCKIPTTGKLTVFILQVGLQTLK